jgi:hypothetical protein
MNAGFVAGNQIMNRSRLVLLLVACSLGVASAQAPLPTPAPPPQNAAPSFPAAEIERIVSPVALYPDATCAWRSAPM